MGNYSPRNIELPKGTKIKRVQGWITWTAGRQDPFSLTGSLDPKILGTVSTVLMEGRVGCPRQNEKQLVALAAWLTASQGETGCKRLESEGILNQGKTQGKRGRR